MVNGILSVFHWLLLQHSSFLNLFLRLFPILLLFISCVLPSMSTLLLSEKAAFVSPRSLPITFYFFFAQLEGGVLTVWAEDMAIRSGT